MRALLAVLAVLCWASTGWAQATWGPNNPTADSQIAKLFPTTKYGGNDPLRTGTNFGSQWHVRGLMVFNLDDTIPPGSQVLNATLVFKTGTGSGTVPTWKIKRFLRVITEADNTWNEYSSGNAWGTAGCNNSTTDYTETNATGSLSAPSDNSTVTITSDSNFTAQVQAAVNAVFFRQVRLIMVGDNETAEAGGTDGSFTWKSKENGTSGDRPTLSIDYVPPGTVFTQ